MKMPIITVWQPWAQWICKGLKRIETRTHDRFASLVGQRIGIHAGLKYDSAAIATAKQFSYPWDAKQYDLYSKDALEYGVLLCTIVVRDFRRLAAWDTVNALCDTTNKFGLILDPTTMYRFSPIPMKGKQGIWYADVPSECF